MSEKLMIHLYIIVSIYGVKIFENFGGEIAKKNNITSFSYQILIK